MPAAKPKRPTARPGIVPKGGDQSEADVSRSVGELARAVRQLEARAKDRVSVVVDLAVGANRIAHRLGRAPIGATVTPTVADATWAWALTVVGDRFVVITTVGVAQPNATVEVY